MFVDVQQQYIWTSIVVHAEEMGREVEGIENSYLTIIDSVPVSTEILNITDVMTKEWCIQHIHMDNNRIEPVYICTISFFTIIGAKI